MGAPAMTETVTSLELGFMRRALEEAAQGAALGEVPIAAVLVHRDTVVASAHNFRETWQDPTAHAEIIAIRAASKRLATWRLLDTTLYVTVEPCTMCLGAVILARIPRVIFGARDPKAGACGSVVDFTQHHRLNHHVEVIGGVLQDESQTLLRDFFRGLRTGGEESEELRPEDVF